MRLVASILLCLTLVGCAPKSLSPQGQTVYQADQIVKRLTEVEHAVIAACNAGTGPSCAPTAPLSTLAARTIVQAIVDAVMALNASPNGWRAVVVSGWTAAKMKPELKAAGVAGYVLAVDALLGVE